MRILVVGAGAVGGYFGGRLLQAGREVTFLVRPARARRLAETGLVIRSPKGDADLPAPTVLTEAIRAPYDVVLLSCKAYDLEAAMESLAPAVGAETAILPLLNGMAHLDALDRRFGARSVLGGQCVISATLDPQGAILHLNTAHALSFGERDGRLSPRVQVIAEIMQQAIFEARASESILLEMWEKWTFLATLAAATCLMRAPVGDIVAAGGAKLTLAMLEEASAIASEAGYAPRAAFLARIRDMLTAPGASTAASMLRDVERGARTEADHILGDLVRRAGAAVPLLDIAHCHLLAYEAGRSREARGSAP